MRCASIGPAPDVREREAVARAQVNGIEIEYALRGLAGYEPIAMIGGLGMQRIS